MTRKNIFPILYGAVPFFRLVVIYWTLGGEFFREYVLFYTILQFFPDVLTSTYDNGDFKRQKSFNIGINCLLAAVTIAMLFVFISPDPSLYLVLGYVLVDHILCVQLPERSIRNNNLQLTFKVLGVGLIAFEKIQLLIVLTILSVGVNLLHQADKPSSSSFSKQFLTSVLTAPFARLRDFSTTVIFQASVGEFGFFLLNMSSRLINAGLAINYQRLRYANFSLTARLTKLAKTIVLWLFSGIAIINIGSLGIGSLVPLIAYLLFALGLETLVTQSTILGVKDVLKRILLVNIWTSGLIAAASFYFREIYAINLVLMLALGNILFYLKNWPTLNFDKSEI